MNFFIVSLKNENHVDTEYIKYQKALEKLTKLENTQKLPKELARDFTRFKERNTQKIQKHNFIKIIKKSSSFTKTASFLPIITQTTYTKIVSYSKSAEQIARKAVNN
ncbi:hypothetical protein Y919_08740 [Caloranaerobacter azorensis H53214]|uniref:Uncharacterized protein n=1 Tax=Caloranaerobacter azorensis H53214 TaxID=1156417 RepID=A0A096CTY5_9FIRM|nr:hypothetical protein Y919_08740 [Caloranaerobacter azorensis H53214]